MNRAKVRGSRFTKAPDQPSIIQGQDDHAIYVEPNLVCRSDAVPTYLIRACGRSPGPENGYDHRTISFIVRKLLIRIEILGSNGSQTIQGVDST